MIQKKQKLYICNFIYCYRSKHEYLIQSYYNLQIANNNNFIRMTFLDVKRRLWKDGEATIAYVVPQLSFSKQKRFKLYSIYWPEKSQSVAIVKNKRSDAEQLARKISKQIDEQEKNQLRMGKGKQSFRKTFTQNLTPNKDGFTSFRETKTSKLSRENQDILKRLAQTNQIRQSVMRDRHGNRSNMFENQEQQFYNNPRGNKPQFNKSQKGFYTSNRKKLELPHNYYPGPGKYEIKRYLQEDGHKIRPKSNKGY